MKIICYNCKNELYNFFQRDKVNNNTVCTSCKLYAIELGIRFENDFEKEEINKK